MTSDERRRHNLYEQVVLPHIDSAYNLARWLTRSDQDAEDLVQDACLRAYRALDGFHGGDCRAWLLAIVRNCCYTWLSRSRRRDGEVPLDDEVDEPAVAGPGPEAALMAKVDRLVLAQAIEDLPAEYREVLVLRDMEDLSYRQIAAVARIPLGTVMSRLSRARARLRQCLARRAGEEHQRGL